MSSTDWARRGCQTLHQDDKIFRFFVIFNLQKIYYEKIGYAYYKSAYQKRKKTKP
jgi:hypothetical protein